MSKRLREKINTSVLQSIVDVVDKDMVEEERKKFRRYAKQMISGTKIAEYSQADYGKGRLYVVNTPSIGGFSAWIRNALVEGLYHDIDMVNCHPVFLQSLCKRNGWECPQLLYYIENREQVLKDVVRFVVCTRSDAKELMLRLMFGGKAETWKKELHKSRAKLPPFIIEFAKELDRLMTNVSTTFSSFPAPGKKNPRASRMSLLLQDMENNVLMVMSDFFKQNGYEPGVYMFDGLMVHKKPDEPITRELLDRCQAEITKRTGWTVKLEEKLIINTRKL